MSLIKILGPYKEVYTNFYERSFIYGPDYYRGYIFYTNKHYYTAVWFNNQNKREEKSGLTWSEAAFWLDEKLKSNGFRLIDSEEELKKLKILL